jgi:hypothetical protein
MNPALANMQQLVSHWKTLQPTTGRKKRQREPDAQPARTKSKTQDHRHSNTIDQNHQHGTQSTLEQNSSS